MRRAAGRDLREGHPSLRIDADAFFGNPSSPARDPARDPGQACWTGSGQGSLRARGFRFAELLRPVLCRRRYPLLIEDALV